MYRLSRPLGNVLLKWARLARLPANQAEESTIATGTVKFFSTYRGYGFIQPSDSSPDVFVHISVVQCAGRSHLVGGQKVSFDVVTKAGESAAGNLKVNLSHLLRIRALFRRIRDIGRHQRPRAARRGGRDPWRQSSTPQQEEPSCRF